MTRTAINLYSVRELDESIHKILDRVADASYDGVQFSGGLRGASPTDARAMLDDRHLASAPAHVSINDLENDLDTIYTAYNETIGCAGVVVPYLDESHFVSREAVDQTAKRLSELANDLSTYDWDLHYHNHAHEFVNLGRTDAFERIIEQTDIGIELDVGWALIGGADPVSLIEAYGDRMDVLHMKDMDAETNEFREIGEGDVDMAACAQAAREADVEWLVYEHDEPDDPMVSIDTGGMFLRDL